MSVVCNKCERENLVLSLVSCNLYDKKVMLESFLRCILLMIEF